MASGSRGRTIGYWVTTALLALGFGGGGVTDLVASPESVKFYGDLGYPAYLLTFFGIAKLLGVVTILAPRLPRLKEWAYAGIVIDLLGAIWSHIAMNDPLEKLAPAVVFLGIALASYSLRPADRRLPDPA
jgi:uncharacterized membrane protein YphA (DoxX/SURF4 family)